MSAIRATTTTPPSQPRLDLREQQHRQDVDLAVAERLQSGATYTLTSLHLFVRVRAARVDRCDLLDSLHRLLNRERATCNEQGHWRKT